MLGVSLPGCISPIPGKAGSQAPELFQTDRVVTVKIVMPENDWTTTQKNPRAEEYVKADLWYDGMLVPGVAVRPKGNSSLQSVARSGSARMSLKVDLNFFNDARNLSGIKKLNFNNGFSDPTLMREVLSYDIFQQMGIPAPRASFVDLWINKTHLGLYTMVEQIDKTFLSRNFPDSNGNLYKPEQPGAFLNWTEKELSLFQKPDSNTGNTDANLGGGKLSEITTALGLEKSTSPGQQAFPGMEPGMQFAPPDMHGMLRNRDYLTSMGLKSNENNNNHQSLLHFLEVLNKEPDGTFQDEIDKVLDVDQVLRYLAVSVTLVHLDNYIGQFGHNYYLYENNGRFTILPWDLNMSFGTFSMGHDRQRLIDFYIDEPTSGPVNNRPLVARLLSVPSYLETYHKYLNDLITGPFSPGVMKTKIDSLANIIRPYVQADTLKFYSTEEFEKALGEDVATSSRMMGMGLNIGLKAFVTQRTGSIKKQLDGTLASKSTDGSGNGGRMSDRGFLGPGMGQIPPGMPGMGPLPPPEMPPGGTSK